MNKLNKLRNFVTIVEKESFTEAAKVLHQSLPSTSRQLSELEEEIGNNLLIRDTRSLMLTEFGRIYYEEAKGLLKHYDDLESLAFLHKKEPEGTLKILAPAYAINKYIIPYISEFRALYPKITPVLEVAERIPRLHNEDVDICMAIGLTMEQVEENTRDVVKKFMFKITGVLCCTPEYARIHGIPKTVDEIKNHPYITHTIRSNPKSLRLKDENIILEPYLYVNSAQTMIACTKNHIGIMQCLSSYIKDELESGELIEILPELSPDADFYMYYKKVRYLEPKVGKFVDFIFSKLDSDTLAVFDSWTRRVDKKDDVV